MIDAVVIVWGGELSEITQLTFKSWPWPLIVASEKAPPFGHHLQADTRPEFVGTSRQLALEYAVKRFGAETVLSTDADVLCLDAGSPTFKEKGVQAARLIDVKGRRWYDWAAYDPAAHSTKLLEYTETSERAYISGGAQIISCEVIESVSYSGLAYHQTDDVLYCERVKKGGFSLLPPTHCSPLLLHLDKLP